VTARISFSSAVVDSVDIVCPAPSSIGGGGVSPPRCIFASPELVSNASISIVGTERNVTLVGMKMCWSDALLYCRDFYSDLLSIRSPEEQEVINELLASASYPLTSRLWVGLRRYLLLVSFRHTSLSFRSSVCPSSHLVLSIWWLIPEIAETMEAINPAPWRSQPLDSYFVY